MEKLYELLDLVAEVAQKECTTDVSPAVRRQLEDYINELIEHDFAKLVELLYRVDVSEKRVKTLLAAHTDTNSAALITDLLIERQLQKRAWRQQQRPNPDIPDEERW